jgi:cytoskeletal protein CcmA (bactofilin family)
MGMMAVMVFTIAATSFMIQQDVTLIYRIKAREQARLLAEAGMSHALVKIEDDGYPSFPQTDFITGSMDTGSYSVDLIVRGGRHLVVSSGTSSGVTRNVSAEVKDDTPTALQYFSGAGNDISIYSFIAGSNINGDLHANGDVSLMSGRFVADLDITGDVSATGIVTEGTTHITDDDYDDKVYINTFNNDTATVFEGADQITFPTFNYTDYQQEASDAGDYYSGDQTFTGTLTPSGGVIYVDGDVDITGDTELTGGIIADNINIGGGLFGATLTQNKVDDDKYNVIIAKDGDLRIYGRLYTEKALLYASQDIRSALALAVIDVNGIMLAGRNISMWNFITIIDYNYVPISPDIAENFQVVSWNS